MVDRYGDAPGILDPGSELTLRRQDATFTMMVEKVRATPKGWIVAFKDLRDRNEAEALAGTELSVDQDRLPPLDEGTYYQFDLIGLDVVTTEDVPLGTVEEIWEPGAHDLLVVRGDRGEILIPAIEPFIREVDMKGRRIVVEMPAGLEEAQRVPSSAAGRPIESEDGGSESA
jgi:16S rRNA processing protein RimM